MRCVQLSIHTTTVTMVGPFPVKSQRAKTELCHSFKKNKKVCVCLYVCVREREYRAKGHCKYCCHGGYGCVCSPKGLGRILRNCPWNVAQMSGAHRTVIFSEKERGRERETAKEKKREKEMTAGRVNATIPCTWPHYILTEWATCLMPCTLCSVEVCLSHMLAFSSVCDSATSCLTLIYVLSCVPRLHKGSQHMHSVLYPRC